MKIKQKILYLLVGIGCLIPYIYSEIILNEWQDTTFGENQTGIVNTAIGSRSVIYGIVLDGSGNIFTTGESDNSGFIAKYTSDGALDDSFNQVGFHITSIGTTAHFTSVSLLDDTIVTAGSGFINGEGIHIALARYTATGDLDNTFGVGGIVTQSLGSGSIANGVIVDNTDQIVVGGTALISGKPTAFLARFQVNGSLDLTFGDDGFFLIDSPFASTVSSISFDSNGNIVAGGGIETVSGNDFFLFRCQPDGSLDGSFGDGGLVTTTIGSTSEIRSLIIDGADNIVVVGHSFDNTGLTENMIIARYVSNGDLDVTFGDGGIVTISANGNGQLYDVRIDSASRIVLAGAKEGYFLVGRLLSDGTIDSSFGDDGFVITITEQSSAAYSAAVRSDDKILLGGFLGLNSTLVQYRAEIDNVVFIANPENQEIIRRELVSVYGTSPFLNSQIDVFIDDLNTPVTSVMSNGSGDWDAGDLLIVSDGPHVIYAELTNTPESRDAKKITVDTDQPVAPQFLICRDTAAVQVGVTYMIPGTAVATLTEMGMRIPAALVVKSLSVQAAVPPGVGATDTWTLRRNGVDTALTTSLSNAQTENSATSDGILFSVDDGLSIRVDGDPLTAAVNILVVVEYN